MKKYKLGDRVLRNPKTWVTTEDDYWGRGWGVGRVVATKPRLQVQWPAGLCVEDAEQLVLFDPKRSEEEQIKEAY